MEVEEELDRLVERYKNGEIDFKELLHQIVDTKVDRGSNALWDYVNEHDEFFAKEMAKFIDEWDIEDFQYALVESAIDENWAFLENDKFMEVVLKKYPSIASWAQWETCAEYLEKYIEPEMNALRARIEELERELEEQGKDPSTVSPKDLLEASDEIDEFTKQAEQDNSKEEQDNTIDEHDDENR